MTARLVALVSGTGSILEAVQDACADGQLDADVVAVGSDRSGTVGLRRAGDRGAPTFVLPPSACASREQWDVELTAAVASYEPHLVLLAGFMRLVGPAFLARFPGRIVNTHPALLPAFPGAHAVRDALDYGVKVTGASVILVDDGVDTGPIVAQRPVPVEPGDDEAVLHERIKAVERRLVVEAVGALLGGYRIDGRTVVLG